MTLAACSPGPAKPVVTVGTLEETLAHLFPEEAGVRSPMIVNFWATWCPPCVAELPDLVQATSSPESGGVQLMTISYDLMIAGITEQEAEEKIRRHLLDHSLDFPVLVLNEDDYEGINQALSLPGPIPLTLAFDATGKEVGRIEGEATLEDFQMLVTWALGLESGQKP